MANTTLSNQMTVEQIGQVKGLRQFSLIAQFLITGSIVVLMGMLAIGTWVTNEIKDGVTRNAAAATALYMESFVAPRIQDLAHMNQLSPGAKANLDKMFKDTELARRIPSVKIWKEGGLIAYSSDSSILGKRFPVTNELSSAFQGEVTAEFGDLHDEEDLRERLSGRSLLEIYSPIREINTGRIIAVAEFYETAESLEDDLFQANLDSWLVVGIAALLMLSALSGIVFRGSRTIEEQRSLLQLRIQELSDLLTQNEELRRSLQESSHRVAEINERYLRRIGADLHDGPAQLISYALLRLDSLRATLKAHGVKENDTEEIVSLRDALQEAMSEIRELSAGLTLAKLEEMSPFDVLDEIIKSHEKRTETAVALQIESIPEDLPLPLKIAMFRFVQEALNNAYQHGEGIDQTVTCRHINHRLELNVADKGPGFDTQATEIQENSGLGLIGLRDRIESLGATLTIESTPGEGTRLTMRCLINAK